MKNSCPGNSARYQAKFYRVAAERLLRAKVRTKRSWANIPPKSNRKITLVFSPWLYKKRNLIERFFSKLKCYRRIASRYDKLGMNFLAMTKLARVRLTLRHNESAA